MSGITLEPLEDVDHLAWFKRWSIRLYQQICQSKQYLHGEGYNPSLSSSSFMYYDVNNLYETARYELFPVGNLD